MAKQLGRTSFEQDAARIRVLSGLASTPVGVVDHGGLNGLTDDDHAQYVHLSAARTITGQHTFNPTGVAPFLVGAGASGYLVSGLNADKADGYDFNQDVRSTAAPTFTGLTVSGNLLVGANVLAVNASGTRVGVNRAADPQFSLDVSGNLRADILVGRHAIQLPEALMILHFDDTLMGHLGQQPYQAANVDYLDPGKFLQGIAVDANTNLSYYSLNNIDEDLGSLMFWVKPGAGRYFLIRHVNGTVEIELYYADGWIIARRDDEQLAIEVTEAAWNHVTFTWDSGDEINLYANGLDARHPICDYYVDSVGGSDSNDGTSEAEAWQTIAKLLTVMAAGDIVGLACGSEWREKITVPGANCEIRMYGSGAKPVLRCDNVMANANFTKTGGYTNVYQQTVTQEYNASFPRFSSVWVDGVRLTYQASIALVDANPGSYYPSSETSTTPTLYIHAPGSSNPITDGKLYEHAARLNTIFSFYAAGTIVHGIVSKRNLSESGSGMFGQSAQIAACEFNEGNKHNLYYGGGSLLLGVICSEAYYTSSATMFIFNQNDGLSMDITHAYCKAICSSLFTVGQGYYGHYNVSGRFGDVVYTDCVSENQAIGFTASHATNLDFIRCKSDTCPIGYQFSDSGQVITITDPQHVELIAGRFNRLVQPSATGVSITINGGYVKADKSTTNTGIIYTANTGCTYTVTGGRYELTSTTAAGSNVFYSTVAVTVNASYNLYKVGATFGQVYYLTSGSAVVTSDYNQFDREATYNTVGASVYSTITLWKAAGYDANGTVATLPAIATPVDDIAFYTADYDLDDLAITAGVISSGLAIAIYESDAPVFAETSIRGWQITPGTVWADEKGLWATDLNGVAVLGVSAVNSESWGGFTLNAGDIAFGRYGASDGGWLLFDRDGDGADPLLTIGYNVTSVMKFQPSGATVEGILKIASGGAIYVGSTPDVQIDTSGITIKNYSGGNAAVNSIKFYNTTRGNEVGSLTVSHVSSTEQRMYLLMNPQSGDNYHDIRLMPYLSGTVYEEVAWSRTLGYGYISLVASGASDSIRLSSPEVRYNGDLKPYRASGYLTGYVAVKLNTPWTKTLTSYSDVGTSTQLDISTFTNAPADTSHVRGVLIQLVCKDSATFPTGGLYWACGRSSTYWYELAARPLGGDYDVEARGWVFTDNNGDLWYQCNASGTNTFDVTFYIWGILV